MSVRQLTLVAKSPLQEEIVHPQFDTIQWMMTRPYDTHWCYQPVMFLSWQQTTYRVQAECPDHRPNVRKSVEQRYLLTLHKHKRLGWFCEYCREGKCSIPFPKSGDKTDWVEAWHWGDTMFFLRDCYIRQNACEKVVAAFMKNGSRAKNVNWKPLSQFTPYVYDHPKNASRVVTIIQS